MASYCRSSRHACLRDFHGSPDAELLAVESHELLHRLERLLLRFLRFFPAPQTPSLADKSTTHVLAAIVNNTMDSSSVDHANTLKAFAQLALQSQKLDAFPDLKTAFWLAHLKEMNATSFGTYKHLLGRPEFPRFVIDCGLIYHSRSWAVVDDSLCDAIHDVVTTYPSVCFGLSLANERATEEARTLDQLKLIEAMLDRIFTHSSSVPICLSVFDLSNNILPLPEQLTVVERIVAKCKSGFYQIKQLKLDGLLPYLGSASYNTPKTTPQEFINTTVSAMSVDTLPLFTSVQPPAPAPPVRDDGASSILHSVSFTNNAMTPNFAREHFSALRYGCPLEEDLTDYSNSLQYEKHGINGWRWLAFALFHPRPKRFQDQYKLRSIGKLSLDKEAIEAIVQTLINPVAQLIYNGQRGYGVANAKTLMVCTVKEGAGIPGIKTLLKTSEFEALWEKKDGSVVVVVPGLGLAEVGKKFVERVEHEPLEPAVLAQNGWYQTTIGVSHTVAVEELRRFFIRIGRQLRSLTVDFGYNLRHQRTTDTNHPDTVVEYIRMYCPHLEQLHLNELNKGSPKEEIAALLEGLATSSGSFRSKLLTLNLNFSDQSIDEANVVQLASILADTDSPPALQELRLSMFKITAGGITALHDALLVNRVLEVIELNRHSSPYPEYAEVSAAEARLEATFQGQLLCAYSPMEAKLAFLGAIDGKLALTYQQPTRARHALDANVVVLILQFAASVETRRLIAWTNLQD